MNENLMLIFVERMLYHFLIIDQLYFQKYSCYVSYITLLIFFQFVMKGKQLQGTIVFKHYRIIQKIGTGAFGQIYKVEDQAENGQSFAIKTQPISTRHPQLIFQAKLYKYLHSEGTLEGIPKVYAAGIQNGYNMMIMDLLGKSLQDIFVSKNKHFSLKTTILVGLQTIDRIQYLHSRGFIHRDIKPDNLMLGIGANSHVIYLIDMGLSKKYICKQKGHIPYREGKQLTGTARYASISTHKGYEQSRRDDIQSIGYILMYFLRGILPWQNMKATTAKAKYDLIKNKKMTTPLEQLCKDFPSELSSFISYSRNLKFDEKPDYNLLRSLLKSAAQKHSIALNNKYDWDSETK